MANKHGKGTTFEMDDADDGGVTLQDISAFVDQSSLQQAHELAVTTAYGDDDETSIVGLGAHQVTCSGPWDPTLDSYFGSTYDFETERSIRFRPEGDASPSYTFEALIESYTIDDSVSDAIRWSASFRPTDAITRA